MSKIEGKKEKKSNISFTFWPANEIFGFCELKPAFPQVGKLAQSLCREPCRCVEDSFTSSMLCMLWMDAQMYFWTHLIRSSFHVTCFHRFKSKTKDLEKWRNFGKKGFKGISQIDRKKERNESKVWVAFKKDFLKKLKYNNLTSQKEVFNCFVSRMRIFEVKVLPKLCFQRKTSMLT